MKVGACAGRTMPLDPDPVEGGNVILTGNLCVGGTALVRVLTKEQAATPAGMFDEPRYVSHFATCPDADAHRRDPRTPRPGKVRHDHPATSHEAAHSRARYRWGTQKAKMLARYTRAYPGGYTDDHIDSLLDFNRPNQTATRRGELVEDGWVTVALDEDGAPLCARTRTGHDAEVYRVRPEAIGAARAWVADFEGRT